MTRGFISNRTLLNCPSKVHKQDNSTAFARNDFWPSESLDVRWRILPHMDKNGQNLQYLRTLHLDLHTMLRRSQAKDGWLVVGKGHATGNDEAFTRQMINNVNGGKL